MYMYVYIYIYVCMYVCMYIYIYIYIYTHAAGGVSGSALKRRPAPRQPPARHARSAVNLAFSQFLGSSRMLCLRMWCLMKIDLTLSYT